MIEPTAVATSPQQQLSMDRGVSTQTCSAEASEPQVIPIDPPATSPLTTTPHPVTPAIAAFSTAPVQPTAVRSHGRKQACPKRLIPVPFIHLGNTAVADLAAAAPSPAAHAAAAAIKSSTSDCNGSSEATRRRSQRSAAAAANDRIDKWFDFHHLSAKQMLKNYDHSSYARPQQQIRPAASSGNASSGATAGTETLEAAPGGSSCARKLLKVCAPLYPHDAVALTMSRYGAGYRLDLSLQKKRAALAVKVQQHLDLDPVTKGIYCAEEGRWDMKSATPGNLVMSSAPMLGLSLTFVPSPSSRKELVKKCMTGVIVKGGDIKCCGCGGVFGRAGFETHLGSNIRHAPDYLVIDELEMTLRDFCVLVSNVDLSLTACVYCFSNPKDEQQQQQCQEQQQQQQQQRKQPIIPDMLMTCPHCPAVFHPACYEQATGENIPDSSSGSCHDGDGGGEGSWCCGSCRNAADCAAAGCTWCRQQQQQQQGEGTRGFVDMVQEWDEFNATLPPPPTAAVEGDDDDEQQQEQQQQQQQQHEQVHKKRRHTAAATTQGSTAPKQTPKKARTQVLSRTVAEFDEERRAEEQRVAAKVEERLRARQQRMKQQQRKHKQQQKKKKEEVRETTTDSVEQHKVPCTTGATAAAAAAANVVALGVSAATHQALDEQLQEAQMVQQQQQQQQPQPHALHTSEMQRTEEHNPGAHAVKQNAPETAAAAASLAAAAPSPPLPTPTAAGSSVTELMALVNQANRLLAHIKKSTAPGVYRTALARVCSAAAGLHLSDGSAAADNVLRRREAWVTVHGNMIQSYYEDLNHPEYQDETWREHLLMMIMNLDNF